MKIVRPSCNLLETNTSKKKLIHSTKSLTYQSVHLLKIVLYKIKAFGGSIKKILQQKKRLFTPKFLTSQLITCQFFFVLIKD